MAIDLERDGAVATIVFNAPERLNAMNREMLAELHAVLRDVAGDRGIRAVILTGAGDRAFVAGADIKEMATLPRSESLAFARLAHATVTAIERLPVPVIAAVNGYALGGGSEISLAADFRYAATNAVFAQPEVTLGIPPGWGGTQRLARAVGEARAAELIFTGRRVSAEEALRIGLVNEVFPSEELLPAAKKTAEQIAANPRRVVQLSKRLIALTRQGNPTSALAEEAFGFADVFETHDQREGMAAFVERRPAAFDHE
ncbi:MAG TPA: enoyl-CoA hydratase-related protein [Thermomicrobiales bacterium]|nr:enoyl-CoA hydratase-related protein [Thermomicrobiales bacterium]